MTAVLWKAGHVNAKCQCRGHFQQRAGAAAQCLLDASGKMYEGKKRKIVGRRNKQEGPGWTNFGNSESLLMANTLQLIKSF